MLAAILSTYLGRDELAHHPDGLDTLELALHCLNAKALDASDKLLRRSMAQNIIQLTTGRHTRGETVSIEKRGVVRLVIAYMLIKWSVLSGEGSSPIA